MDLPEFDVRPYVAQLSADPLGVDPAVWIAACHAYGPAYDVPALLSRAAGGDVESAGQAMAELGRSAWHQGTLYSAAALATPFLLDAAGDPAVHERAGMLLMVASAARRSRLHDRGRDDLFGVAYTEPRYDTASHCVDWTNEAARAAVTAGHRPSACCSMIRTRGCVPPRPTPCPPPILTAPAS